MKKRKSSRTFHKNYIQILMQNDSKDQKKKATSAAFFVYETYYIFSR